VEILLSKTKRKQNLHPTNRQMSMTFKSNLAMPMQKLKTKHG